MNKEEFLLIIDREDWEIIISEELLKKSLPTRLEVSLSTNIEGNPSLKVKLHIIAEGENIIRTEVENVYSEINRKLLNSKHDIEVSLTRYDEEIYSINIIPGIKSIIQLAEHIS